MKNLKCSSCGAKLQVDENNEYAVCDHCGSKYKLNEDLNVNIKLDDNVKEVLNNGLGTFNNISKIALIPIIIIVIIVLLLFVFGVTNINKNGKISEKTQQQIEDKTKEQEEIIKSQQEESKKALFNFQFTNDNGTKSAFFLESTLDEIIQSNKTYDKKVILVFDGLETVDESKIIEIKHSLNGNYEVSFNYDSDGYINKIIVDKIN